MLRVNTRIETQGDRTGGEERLNIRALPQPLVRESPAGELIAARNCRASLARPQPLVRRAPARASLSVRPCSPGAPFSLVRQLLLSCLCVPTRSSAAVALVGP